jgi:hypothetical protein
MSSRLEQLAELVRQAEIKATSEKLQTDVQKAADRLKEAEAKSRDAEERLRQLKLTRGRELAELETREQQLKELTQKAARFRTHLDQASDVEQLIVAERAEIDTRRRDAQQELETATKESEVAKGDLKIASTAYRDVRQNLDRLHPGQGEAFSGFDRLLSEAETLVPAGKIRALEREVEDGSVHFGTLTRAEQYAQMKIWIGRLRALQALELVDDEIRATNRLFGNLVGISKTYEPGYIEAFRQEYRANWDIFVADAQEELRQAAEASRQRNQAERVQREQQHAQEEKKRHARDEAQIAIQELRGVITRFHLPDEGSDEFRDALRKVTTFGMSDPELLELVLPYRELITEGGEFRALRRNLDRMQQEATAAESNGSYAGEIADIVERTRGMRVVLIGGARREDVRKQLQQLFEFDRLDWEDHEASKPALLDSLEQRVRNRGIDLMLILRSFISHHVPGRFRPLCEQHGIPCLMVEQGYGAAQIAKTLRTGLPAKSAVQT